VVKYGLRKVVVVLADVLPDFRAVAPSQVETACPRGRVSPRIIDRNLILQRASIGARKAFDQMKAIGMRQAIAAYPELFIEADSVHYQCVALPMPKRIAIVTRY